MDDDVSGTYEKFRNDQSEREASADDLQQELAAQKMALIDEDPQQFLEEHFSVEDVIAIPDSAFGMVLVDHAMARNRWFFVKKIDDRLIYISELPETDSSVIGYLDTEGTIYLEFLDLESNLTKYQSTDGGLHWKKI